MSKPAKQETPAAPPTLLAEVKYPLPELLSEIANERATGSFGMEKLDQQEIQKLFKAKAPRREKSKK